MVTHPKIGSFTTFTRDHVPLTVLIQLWIIRKYPVIVGVVTGSVAPLSRSARKGPAKPNGII